MTPRTFNFGAGPAALPAPVLAEMQRHLQALPGGRLSVLEISHRSHAFSEILEAAESNVRRLAGLSDDYAVLFVPGGATLQFAMAPLNLLTESANADYVVTGVWARHAAAEAARFGRVHVAATTEADDFTRVPQAADLDLSPAAAYVHLTSNNTIVGTAWAELPATGDVPLVVDASSDIFSRPIDLAATGIGLLYAGAQKNLGVAGITLVVIRRDLVARVDATGRVLPSLLRYATYAEHGSRYNTPPVFAIYVLERVTRWLIDAGGLSAMAERNARKARRLYAALDRGNFYRGTASPASRSRMNVTWRLPDPALDAAFVAEAADAGLVGLAGHRSVGGVRASIYNACPEAAVAALVDFMAEFERVRG